MKLLLDTHTYLFAIDSPDQLGGRVLEMLQDATVERSVSVVCFWELVIKVKLGKLEVPLDRAFHTARLTELRAECLPVRFDHTMAMASLPGHHRDPFDRLLIAQALEDGFTLATRDAEFGPYGVPTVW